MSHDLSVISTNCDHVGVMYAGELVEIARRDTIFEHPSHPYTRALIAAVPRLHEASGTFALRLPGMFRRETLPSGCTFCEAARIASPQVLAPIGDGHTVACRRHADPALLAEPVAERPVVAGSKAQPHVGGTEPALSVRDLSCSYRRRRSLLAQRQPAELVVKDVSFTIAAGETFALVGESGSGKSTIAKAIVGIVPAASGEILLQGQPLPADLRPRSRALLRHIQIIPQNPYASLNPRQPVEAIVGRPLQVFFGLGRKQ